MDNMGDAENNRMPGGAANGRNLSFSSISTTSNPPSTTSLTKLVPSNQHAVRLTASSPSVIRPLPIGGQRRPHMASNHEMAAAAAANSDCSCPMLTTRNVLGALLVISIPVFYLTYNYTVREATGLWRLGVNGLTSTATNSPYDPFMEAVLEHPDYVLNISEEHIPKVALGCGITTRKVRLDTKRPLTALLPFFKHLLPSFCLTAAQGFLYVFYMAYDFNDPLLASKQGRHSFTHFFYTTKIAKCKPGLQVAVKFVECNHTHKPAWAQNDAMMAAYADNMTYYYMTNDDTVMVTPDWTKQFVKTLKSLSPANVGVVGPEHKGGNTAILTYHFVHRTHIDIFGYFYPRNFTDWYADDWITGVYKPNNIKKLHSVKLTHTMEAGRRYSFHTFSGKQMQNIFDHSKPLLRRYLEDRNVSWTNWTKKRRG